MENAIGFIYFQASEQYWWSDEFRTYNGQAEDEDWIYYTGDFFRTELGKPFAGTFNATSDTDNEFSGRIHSKNIRFLRAEEKWKTTGLLTQSSKPRLS